MGRVYGYMEDYGRKVGGYKICTSCDHELTASGKLVLVSGKILLPDGTIYRPIS